MIKKKKEKEKTMNKKRLLHDHLRIGGSDYQGMVDAISEIDNATSIIPFVGSETFVYHLSGTDASDDQNCLFVNCGDFEKNQNGVMFLNNLLRIKKNNFISEEVVNELFENNLALKVQSEGKDIFIIVSELAERSLSPIVKIGKLMDAHNEIKKSLAISYSIGLEDSNIYMLTRRVGGVYKAFCFSTREEERMKYEVITKNMNEFLTDYSLVSWQITQRFMRVYLEKKNENNEYAHGLCINLSDTGYCNPTVEVTIRKATDSLENYGAIASYRFSTEDELEELLKTLTESKATSLYNQFDRMTQTEHELSPNEKDAIYAEVRNIIGKNAFSRTFGESSSAENLSYRNVVDDMLQHMYDMFTGSGNVVEEKKEYVQRMFNTIPNKILELYVKNEPFETSYL